MIVLYIGTVNTYRGVVDGKYSFLNDSAGYLGDAFLNIPS
jgi:hypothetical protein